MDAMTKDLIAAMAKAKKWWTVPEIEKVFEAGEVPQKVEKLAKVEKAPAPVKAKKAAGTDKAKGKGKKAKKGSKAEKVEVEAAPVAEVGPA